MGWVWVDDGGDLLSGIPVESHYRERRWVHKFNDKRSRRLAVHHENLARREGRPYEFVDLGLLYHRSEGLCGICGCAVAFKDFTVDHIHPVSKGGGHTRANVQIAHFACNTAKGDGIPAA